MIIPGLSGENILFKFDLFHKKMLLNRMRYEFTLKTIFFFWIVALKSKISRQFWVLSIYSTLDVTLGLTFLMCQLPFRIIVSPLGKCRANIWQGWKRQFSSFTLALVCDSQTTVAPLPRGPTPSSVWWAKTWCRSVFNAGKDRNRWLTPCNQSHGWGIAQLIV